MPDAREPAAWLHAGRVGRPHGLDGSFYVAQPRAALLDAGRKLLVGAREDEIVRRAGTDARPIVRLASCTDRGAAEALRGAELLVAQADAPPLEEDEWWPEQLEGCQVRDGEREVGIVRALRALPSCEVLEVARPGDAEDLLVPLIHDAVREVDVEARRIDIDLAFLGADDDAPVDPAHPADRATPGDPAHPVDAGRPADRATPGDPAHPVDRGRPADRAHPTGRG